MSTQATNGGENLAEKKIPILAAIENLEAINRPTSDSKELLKMPILVDLRAQLNEKFKQVVDRRMAQLKSARHNQSVIVSETQQQVLQSQPNSHHSSTLSAKEQPSTGEILKNAAEKKKGSASAINNPNVNNLPHAYDPIRLDCSNCGLKSFDAVYAMIMDFAKSNAQLKYDTSKLNISEIDLSNNQMTHFYDVGNSTKTGGKFKRMHKLKSVTCLNVLDNLTFDNIKETVRQIQLVLPCVSSLHISLSEEDDVSFIIMHMPQLEVLNGIRVVRSANTSFAVPSVAGREPGAPTRVSHTQSGADKSETFYASYTQEINIEGTSQSDATAFKELSQNIYCGEKVQVNSERRSSRLGRAQRKSVQGRRKSAANASANPNAKKPDEVRDLNLVNRKSKSHSRSPAKMARDDNEENKASDTDGLRTHLSKVLSDVREQLTPHPVLAAAGGDARGLGGMQLVAAPDNSQQRRAEADAFSGTEDSLGNFANRVLNFRSMDQRCEPAQMNSVSSPLDVDDRSRQYAAINIEHSVYQEESQQSKERSRTGSRSSTDDELSRERPAQARGSEIVIAEGAIPQGSLRAAPVEVNGEEDDQTDSPSLYENYLCDEASEQLREDRSQHQQSHNVGDSNLSPLLDQQHSQYLIQKQKQLAGAAQNYDAEGAKTSADDTHHQLSAILEEDDTEIEAAPTSQTGTTGKLTIVIDQQHANHAQLAPAQQLQGIGIGLQGETPSAPHSREKGVSSQLITSSTNSQANNQSSRQKSNGHYVSINQIPSQNAHSSKNPMLSLHQSNFIKFQSNVVSKKQEPKVAKQLVLEKNMDINEFVQVGKSFAVEAAASFDCEREPVLKPQDLEDLANIFDRIRALYRKKVETQQSSKKLIAKANSSKIDDLAVQFDKKLSEIMQKLAGILKDRLIAPYQKHCEIEQAKFMLYHFCQDACNRILASQKQSMTPMDSKELFAIQEKVTSGMQTGFFNIGKLFYSREEQEVRRTAEIEINRVNKRCHDYEELKALYEDACGQLQHHKEQLSEMQQICCEQADELASLRRSHDAAVKKGSEQAHELVNQCQELADLRVYRERYDELQEKNKRLELQVERLQETGEGRDLEAQSLNKKLRIKEKELQRQTRLVSHLKEELREMREEAGTLADENQKYLDMIIKQSLRGKGQNDAAREADVKWLRRHILKGRRSVFLTQHDWEYRSIVSPTNTSVSPYLGKSHVAEFGQRKNELSITQKSTLIQRRKANGSLMDGKSCGPFGGGDNSALSPSRRESLFVVDSPTYDVQEVSAKVKASSTHASKAAHGSKRASEKMSRACKSGDGASQVTDPETSKAGGAVSRKSAGKASRLTRSQKDASSLPPPPKSGYAKRSSYLKSMSLSRTRSPIAIKLPQQSAVGMQDDGTETTVVALCSNVRSKLRLDSEVSRTVKSALVRQPNAPIGSQQLKESYVRGDTSRSRAAKAPVIKNTTQRSQENIGPTTQEGEELQRSAMKKLNKVESQIIEASCSKGQFAGAAVYTEDASKMPHVPLKVASYKQDKSVASGSRGGISLKLQTHMVSMQEVEPSSRKDGNTPAQGDSAIQQVAISNLYGDKIDSSIVHDDQISKDGLARVDFGKESDPTRVPPLAFGGIGFSFNENSQAMMKQQRSSKVRASPHSVSPSDTKKQVRLLTLQQDGGDDQGDRKAQDASTMRSKSLPETTSLAGFQMQPLLNSNQQLEQMRTFGSQMELNWMSNCTASIAVPGVHYNGAPAANKQIHEHIRRKLRKIDPETRPCQSFGDNRFNYLSTGGNMMSLGGPQLRLTSLDGQFTVDSNAYDTRQSFLTRSHGASLGLNYKRGSNASNGGGSKGHFNLSLNHMRDLIQDIYAQKVRHDDKCINMNQQNRETMEQFLGTYLSQKYGLKSLVMDQANAVIAAIAQYQDECQEVLLFGKVLRHMVDEEFRQEQMRLRSSITHFMKQCYRERHPTKSQRDILRHVADVESGKVNMDHWLWNKLLALMFDSTDVFILQDKLRKVNQLRTLERMHGTVNSQQSLQLGRGQVFATDTRAEERRKSREHVQRRSLSRYHSGGGSQQLTAPSGKARTLRGRTSSVQMTQAQNGHAKFKYADFVSTLLSFQLAEHEKYLQPFLVMFRKVDQNNDGVISNAEFIELCRLMHHTKVNFASENMQEPYFMHEVNRLLDIADPYQSNKITLSDVIQLFSSQKAQTQLFQQRSSPSVNLQDSNDKVMPLKYMQRSGRADPQACVGMETTDSNFRSFNYQVPNDDINAQSPMLSIIPQHVRVSQTKSDQVAVDTFAPNSHATSKVVLHQIPEEDLAMRTGDENVEIMTGDEAGTRQYHLHKQDYIALSLTTPQNQEYLESLKKESEDEQRAMALRLAIPSPSEPVSAGESALSSSKLLRSHFKSDRKNEAAQAERKFSHRGHLGLARDSIPTGEHEIILTTGGDPIDVTEMAIISEHEQRVSNEIAELERKLAERWRQAS